MREWIGRWNECGNEGMNVGAAGADTRAAAERMLALQSGRTCGCGGGGGAGGCACGCNAGRLRWVSASTPPRHKLMALRNFSTGFSGNSRLRYSFFPEYLRSQKFPVTNFPQT